MERSKKVVWAAAVPLTWGGLSAERQRDWAREESVPSLAQIIVDHHGRSGTSFLWEQPLLGHHGPDSGINSRRK